MDKERFCRQIILPEIGVSGQEQIIKASVLVIGAGGLGSPVLTYLCAAGVGRITIMDQDQISVSNLQRQVLYNTSQIGFSKVHEAAKRLTAINPKAKIEPVNKRFSKENASTALLGHDIIVDCTDNRQSRYLIDDAANKHNIPWVYGSIEGFSGQLSLFNYRNSGFSYRKLFPETAETQKANPVGVIGALPGIIGSMQALETLKTILGIPSLSGKLFVFDGIKNSSYLLNLPK